MWEHLIMEIVSVANIWAETRKEIFIATNAPLAVYQKTEVLS